MIIRIINNLVTRLKGKTFQLNENIPFSYICSLVFRRSLMLVRGFFSFLNYKKIIFIGKSVKIRSKKSIKLGIGVTIDDGCYIDALSSSGLILGNNVSLGKRTVIECGGSLKYLGKGITVGDNVGLGRDCFYGCAGGIYIGEDTIIGNYVSFHSENHNINNFALPIRLQGVTHKGIKVGKDCWIGAKATILDGAHINDGCVIAAGSVVIAGIYEAYGIYAGVPARLVKKRK